MRRAKIVVTVSCEEFQDEGRHGFSSEGEVRTLEATFDSRWHTTLEIRNQVDHMANQAYDQIVDLNRWGK